METKLAKIAESANRWLAGDPPMNDKELKTLKDEFSLLLYVSGVFIHPRHYIINFPAPFFNFSICSYYIYLLFQTTIRQLDDFITASQTMHMMAVDMVAMSILFGITLQRKSIMDFLRSMAVNFFDYGDDFVIPEMKEELRKTRKQKLIILVTMPTYLAATATCCMLARPIDNYFDRATNESYINEVYMFTPIPMWYPFVVDTPFKHFCVILSQVLGANTLGIAVAGADAVIIFFSQNLATQFRILTYRIRKIDQIAYRRHRKSGGRKFASKKDMFDDPNYMKCYNKCLRLNAEHHAILVENFLRLDKTMRYPTGIALLFGSLLIAMSLLAFALGGGKPSILSLAVFLVIAEVLNMAVICSQSEIVQSLGESLQEELYNINWMDADGPAKKTIMIMIERSKKPLVLKAGGITALNWETFSALMSVASLAVKKTQIDNFFEMQRFFALCGKLGKMQGANFGTQILNTAYSYVNLLLATDL